MPVTELYLSWVRSEDSNGSIDMAYSGGDQQHHPPSDWDGRNFPTSVGGANDQQTFHSLVTTATPPPPPPPPPIMPPPSIPYSAVPFNPAPFEIPTSDSGTESRPYYYRSYEPRSSEDPYSSTDSSQPFYHPSPKRRGRRPKKTPTSSQPPYKRSPARTYRSPGRPRKSKSVTLAQARLLPLDQIPTAFRPEEPSTSLATAETGERYKEESLCDLDDVFLKIIEQPQAKALRFRYICEGRSAGSIPGINSSPENKTYPSVKLINYEGCALVVVSCVTVEQPYRPHPHNLVGKEGCEGGICSVKLRNDSLEYSFSNLGIQCVKKRDVDKSLLKRQEKGIDPFCTGFRHRSQPQNIDLNAVRLCFQVYLQDKQGEFTIPIKPIVSDPIFDKKATSELVINKLSDCSSPAEGGKEIILLCDKVTKEDVQVRFFETSSDRIQWEAYGDFQASDVHKQVAISFKTPQYKNLYITEMTNTFVQLYRPSDKCTSQPRAFFYYPTDSGHSYLNRKLFKRNIKEKDLLELLKSNLLSIEPRTHDQAVSARAQDVSVSNQVPPEESVTNTFQPIPVATTVYQNTLYQSNAYPSTSQMSTRQDLACSNFSSPYDTSSSQGERNINYGNTSNESTAFYREERLLDLDTQYLVHNIDPLSDLNLIFTKDLPKEPLVSKETSTEVENVQSEHNSPPHELDCIDSPERSSSPNSDVKKLKLDLEALNKLTR